VIQAAANFGATPLRDGSTQATAKFVPFGSDEYAVFAFIETVVLANEAQGNERLSYTQRLMLINPMIQSATTYLVAAEDDAVSRYATDSAPEMSEPKQRRTVSAKILAQLISRDDSDRAVARRRSALGSGPLRARRQSEP